MIDPAPTPAPDPTPAPQPDPAPVPAPAPDPTPPTAMRPDYLPEKFWKGDAANVEALAKSYGELEKRLSTMRPGEVPESADLYDFKPAELPAGVEWNEDAASRFAAAFHSHGVSTDAAKDIGRLFAEVEAENQTAIAAAYQQQLDAGNAALKKEWGPQFNEKLGKIKSVVASLGGDPKDAELFSNAKVVSFLGRVVGMLNEDSVASMRGAVAPGGTFVNGAEEARAIMLDAKHPEYAAYHEGDRTAIAKVARLLNA